MRTKMLLALGAFVVVASGFVGANAACPERTAAGSCKDSSTHQISCGDKGQVPVAPGGVRAHANQTDNGAEVEACSDQGGGNQHGRLMAEVDSSEQGARVILDSDPDQPFPAGWIILQGSAKNGNANGLYCSVDDGDPGVARGDGYRQSWRTPGGESGADCVPEPPI